MKIWIQSGIVLGLALALSGCGQDAAAETDQPVASPALTVDVITASARDMADAIELSGTVAPWQAMQLGVELSGVRIAEVLVETGAVVRKGAVLLRLDDRTIASELRQAEAMFHEAEAGVMLAQTNLDRGQSLLPKKLISAADFDLLRAQMVQAEARLATSAAQRDAARLRLDFTVLRAPDDGVIGVRMAEPGQVVMAGAELMRLTRQGRLEWRAELSEADLLRVKPGAQVIVLDRLQQEVAGKVRAVTPGLDPRTRTATVYVDLPEPGALRSGMFADGRILASQVQALSIPVTAVVRRDGFAYVFTLGAGNRVARTRVEVGRADGEYIEVRAGLDAGARIVSKGAAFLADGDLVRVASGG